MHHDWLSYSREGNVLHAPPLCSFRILTFLQKNILLHTVPNSIGICRQQTKFATFTLSLQNGKKFFIPLVYVTLEFLPLYTTLKNQTFHFYEKSGFLLILVQMSEANLHTLASFLKSKSCLFRSSPALPDGTDFRRRLLRRLLYRGFVLFPYLPAIRQGLFRRSSLRRLWPGCFPFRRPVGTTGRLSVHPKEPLCHFQR